MELRTSSRIVSLLLVLRCIATNYESFYNFKMVYHGHAVTSNAPECASIGMDILKNHNGTAVDATIATLFCEGAVLASATGLGGGLIATIYDKSTRKVETVVARERAPLASTLDMFANMTKVSGILSIAVPGALKGYAEMHSKYGRTPWKLLIQPTIDLCRSGHTVSKYSSLVLVAENRNIRNSPSLREVFVNPKTGRVWRAGDKVKREKLAQLEIVCPI